MTRFSFAPPYGVAGMISPGGLILAESMNALKTMYQVDVS